MSLLTKVHIHPLGIMHPLGLVQPWVSSLLSMLTPGVPAVITRVLIVILIHTHPKGIERQHYGSING